MNANAAPTSTNNLHIAAFHAMPTPQAVQAKLPLTGAAARTVANGRADLIRILEGKDKRRFVVVGPCSIHDPVAGMDYARRLKVLAAEVSDVLMIVMIKVVYFVILILVNV